MATRFYLSSTAAAPGTPVPGFAAWTRTTEGDRKEMKVDKDGSALTSITAWAGTSPGANGSALFRQYISPPMAAGVAFSTSDTIKGVFRCLESAANDNINRQPVCLKVYAADGTTLQSTLIALAHIGPATTEWATSLTNRRFADGDTLAANYTTVAGDRLVLELGGQVDATGGTSTTGTINFGTSAASDLAEDETSTAANNPFFEISRTISFLAPQDADDSWWSTCLQRAASVAFISAAASLLSLSQAVAAQPQDEVFAPPIAESSGPNMGPVLWPVLTAIPAPYRWAIDEIVPQPAPLADDDSGFRQTIPWPPSPLLGPQYHQDEVEILPADDDAGYRPVLPNAAPVPGLVWASDDLPVTPATPIDDDARWFPAPMQADPAGSAVWMVDASEVSPGQATGAIADDETGGAPWLLFEPSAWTTILAPWTFDQGESFTPAVTEDYWQIPAQIAQVRFSQPLLGDEEIVPQPPPAVAHEAYWQNPVAPVIWTPPAILLQPWRHDNQELVAPALPNEAYWINSVAPVIWKPAPVLLQPWRDDSQDAVTAAPTAPPNEEHWTSGVAPTVWTPPGRLLQPWQWDNQEIPTPPPAFVDDDAGWFQHVQSVAVLPLIPWADSAEPAFPPAVPEDTAGPAWLLVPVSTWTTILAPWTFDQGESSGEAIASVVCRLRERGLPDFTLTEQGRPAFRVRDASREAFSLTDRSRP